MNSKCNVSLLINHQVYIWMLTIILYIYPIHLFIIVYKTSCMAPRVYYLKQNVRWLVLYIIQPNPTTNKRRQKYWNVIVCGVYTKLLLRFLESGWWEYSENGVILNVFTQVIYKTHLNYIVLFRLFHFILYIKPLLLHLNFNYFAISVAQFFFLFYFCTNAFNTLISFSLFSKVSVFR